MNAFQSYLVLAQSQELRRQCSHQIIKDKNTNPQKTSPDIFVISPQKTAITIDQIRELKKHIFQKPVKEKFKFVTIENAQKLTIEAQNALLKILEEPPEHAILILEAFDKTELLPTIISRVIVKYTKNQKPPPVNKSVLENPDPFKLLEVVAGINNPEDWLDNQIIALHQDLKLTIKDKKKGDSSKITRAINLAKEAKKLIGASVNPKFVLANLIFSLTLDNENSLN